MVTVSTRKALPLKCTPIQQCSIYLKHLISRVAFIQKAYLWQPFSEKDDLTPAHKYNSSKCMWEACKKNSVTCTHPELYTLWVDQLHF